MAADGKVPIQNLEQSTDAIFPGAGTDVPAPRADELNAHAWELQAENAKKGPGYVPSPDWTTK